MAHGNRRGRALIRVVAAVATIAVAGACQRGGSAGSAPSPSAAAVAPSAGPPHAGGRLVVAVPAEPLGLDPIDDPLNTTGLIYARAVFDSLTAFGPDGAPHAFLAQSVTHDATLERWTIRARSGVAFHDGEPFDANAIKANLDARRIAALAGQALLDIDHVDIADPLTAVVVMKAPWSTFPAALAGEAGLELAPASLADPNRARRPVGTGPFIFQEWLPGDHFRAVRNPHYWRPGLPYLDSIELRSIDDPEAREAALTSGAVDALVTSDTQTIVDLREAHTFPLIEETRGRVQEDAVVLNTAAAPFNDRRVRLALALATDAEKFNQVVHNGILRAADGPFSDGSGYANASGYPGYDPSQARELVAAYERDNGLTGLTFRLATLDAPKDPQTYQLLTDMWRQVGIEAVVVAEAERELDDNVHLGRFQAAVWRGFGDPEPDGDTPFVSSATAGPIGQPAANIARLADPAIDVDLAAARATTDARARHDRYNDVAAALDRDLPFVWIDQVIWLVAASPTVHDLDRATFPDGAPARALTGGVFSLATVWVDPGR